MISIAGPRLVPCTDSQISPSCCAVNSPFYVYAYAFGDCLVNSLYAVYEKAEAGFAERYLRMLAAGGTKHHAELLKPFGLDARDPAFWQGGLSVIAGLIDQLEELEKVA